ncbi:Rv3654c family TadE-like protein [Streptomyces sp. NPDC007088]|uniref:Rv3654c family TadE-like protein n=1 Tax=Streptomyces sp. NPDC007088 TaxID=3364773 RepID=UPI0036C3F4BD
MWVVVTMSVLGLLFAAALGTGQAVVARHRAAGTADLAALAAADSWVRGPEAACAAARRVARAQGGLIEVCSVRGQIAEVAARAALGPYAVRVRARAGPPGAAP